ncbi:MAG TPA: glycosyltransferase family 1 protein [Chloroflexi bacterium]|nr:glycosyltransferase family 1 protein [Chloroflexota bacterium]
MEASQDIQASSLHVVIVDFNFFAYAVQLSNALSEVCEVSLFFPYTTPEIYTGLIKPGVNFHSLHTSRLRDPRNMLMIASLFKTLRQLRPDVVHQLGWHPWLNLALPLFPDIPRVTTIHDASVHPGDKESFTFFQNRQWRGAARIIVHAEEIKRQMIEGCGAPASKIHVIPIGAYSLLRAWRSDPPIDQSPTILFFGRIWDYKGLQYLIEAEPLITQQVPNARIVIAGQGESFDKYEQMMVHKEHFIVHNYYIPDKMVSRLFEEASVVALPYVEASQSAVLAIAYAFGKPVVATTVGGIPEVLQHGETGFLVPPRDAKSLAQAIINLLQNDALRAEMGRKALDRAEGDLSWQSVARKTHQVYQQAVARHSGRG